MSNARALAAVLLSVCAFAPSYAQASADGQNENDRLLAGETIRFPQAYNRGGQRFIGGLSYAVVPGVSGNIEALCDDVEAWKAIVPRIKEAHVLARRGDELYIELTQGNALLEARYTLHVHLDYASGEAHFWMVHSRPHDIEDAWGFFRFEPLPVAGTTDPARTRVTFGVLVDIGSTFLSDVVEPRVQASALSIPDRLRDYLRRQASR